MVVSANKGQPGSKARGGTGAWSRSALSAQVLGVIVLAFLGAALVTYLASLPGLRKRVDLTAMGSNTLDPVLAEIIEKLPEKVTIEVFFRPLDAPLTRVGAEAQSRMAELLFVARHQFPDKLRVRDHDLSDVSKVAVRMRELDVHEDNVIVVTREDHKVVLKLLRDLARVDPGNPMMKVEPSLEAFRGEEALGNALLRVSIEETPRVAFTLGHGERDLYDSEKSGGLGRLHSALIADGLRAERWDSTQSTTLPEGTRVVAIVEPRQPFSSGELETLERFLAQGGRLFVTPSGDSAIAGAPGSIESFLAKYGVKVLSGLVAQPVPDGFGSWRMGVDQCGTIVVAGAGIEKRHAITESLWRTESRVGLPNVRALKPEGSRPANALLIDLLRSPDASWRDLPQAGGRGDWNFDQRAEEEGPFALAMALAWAPDGAVESGSERTAARVVALGTADALSNDVIARNRDFVLNTFNWLAQRDHRLVIRPRTVERRQLDLANTNALSVFNALAFGVLPGICVVLGLVVAFVRRR